MSGLITKAPSDIHIDFETFCQVSVVDVGAWKYSEHPSCEVLCMAVSYDDGDPRIWLPHMGPPEKLFWSVKKGARVHAHNAQFEYAIWNNVLAWPEIPLEQLHCSMALVANFSFPLSLEKAGEAIGTQAQKDKEGKRLLKKFSMPRKPTKKDSRTRILPEEDPEDFEALCNYCIQDVRTEKEIVDSLPRSTLSEKERKIYILDQVMNRRGVKIDVETARHVRHMADQYAEKIESEAQLITGGIKTSQRAEIIAWADKNGYTLENYQAEYIRESIEDPAMPEKVRQVLTRRKILGKTSVTKYAKMIMCAGSGDRARGMVQYYGAQRTGRFAGRLIQVHNLPRGTIKNVHKIASYIRHMTADDLELIFGSGQVTEVLSSLIRSMVVADEGWELFVTDFANIEGRVLAWMARQRDLVELFENGVDVYKHMAAIIFGVTYEEVTDDQRFVGKQAVLGCGYGMGGPKFRITCQGYGRDIGDSLSKATVKTYRKTNNKIVKSWYAVDEAARLAIRFPGQVFEAFMCKFCVEGDFLFIKLPSGRCLAYNRPAMRHDSITYMGVDQFSGKWVRIDTYGGKLVENIVQATARDILAEAMLRVEKRGYLMLTTIHDELIATARVGEGQLEEYNGIIKERPEWALECPIDVEGWVGTRYRK